VSAFGDIFEKVKETSSLDYKSFQYDYIPENFRKTSDECNVDNQYPFECDADDSCIWCEYDGGE